MRCEEAQELLSEHLNEALLPQETLGLEAHLAGCEDCSQALAELRIVTELLHAVPQEPLPAGLAERIHAALEALPDEPAQVEMTPAAERKPADGPVPFWKRFSVPSAVAGAAAAAAALIIWNMQPSSLPRIETAAVKADQNVAVNIGFDVASNVDGVTFQVDLPDGLKFVDDSSQPMLAQSVSWKGSLKKGKTVIPIVVRGVRPGKWNIEAYVRKGSMVRKTTIVLPVQAG